MWYIGVDAHKTRCSLTAKTRDGEVVRRLVFPHRREGWRQAFAGVPEGSKVAVECVGWYQGIFDLLEEMGFKPILAHARELALIAKSKRKTDRRDSEILADLLRTDFLPTSHVPSKATRELRELTRSLDVLTKDATKVKNRVHRLLERAWADLPDVQDLFGKTGRIYLARVQLEAHHRVVLDSLLDQLDNIEKNRDMLQREIARRIENDADVHRLLEIDGINLLSAAVLKAEIDTVTRFQNRYQVRSNFGMAVTVRDSADTQRRGHITKQGPGIVRKILVQAAPAFIRQNPQALAKHKKIATQRGTKVARVASGNDLLDVVYQVLKTNTPYRYARPSLAKEKKRKLARLSRPPEALSVA